MDNKNYSYLFKNSALSKSLEDIGKIKALLVPDSIAAYSSGIQALQKTLATPFSDVIAQSSQAMFANLRESMAFSMQIGSSVAAMTANMQIGISTAAMAAELSSTAAMAAELSSAAVSAFKFPAEESTRSIYQAIQNLSDTCPSNILSKIASTPNSFSSILDGITFDDNTISIPNELAELTTKLCDSQDCLFEDISNGTSYKISSDNFKSIVWPLILSLVPLLFAIYAWYSSSMTTTHQHEELMKEEQKQTTIQEQQLIEEQQQTELLENLVSENISLKKNTR